MIRITNKTNKKIPISKNIMLMPFSSLTVNSSITPNIFQLMNMNLITIKEINPNNLNSNDLSSRDLKRQENMNLIRNGYKSESISLDTNNQTKQRNKPKQKRNKRNVNNKKVGE